MLKIKLLIIFGLLVLMASLTVKGQDLCTGIDMKPVLSLEQVTQAELVDFLCEIAGIKDRPEWPSDISGMTPEQYYEMEVELLIKYGFPPILIEIEPSRIANRRYFASLMFKIAMEVDDAFQKDCKDAMTETEQLNCLVKHQYLFSDVDRIYKDEILSVLCNKKDILKELMPPPRIEIPEIYPEEFREASLEQPATPGE